ncbi:MAG TPA: glycosyltransferase [Cyclobacteriaceae bacterium]|nr:hypothetical protein [Cyclobacteriaceae bacterium]MCB9238729.1 glycosyltransferase [Flammeovirgaceae bacterium]MCB0498005.1 hypothetical protein [Cyclobacteriaceae bacterium]MCO5270447.1 hypothetical protein [Cyclobacteriaceae bacterium]MCW5901111.1 hypothetical protein [Cyclobacteriaceae bacterium]
MKTNRILVAPLDWGLGHATRCMPVIQLLLKNGHEVHVASGGGALRLLQLEFPQLKSFTLPSYGARYGRHLPFMATIFLQMPKFLWAIHREHRAIKKIAKENPYDLIISDNRYGCRVPHVKSVFICHQLHIIMPKGWGWLQAVVNYFNHKWILKFDRCWVPDDPFVNLSGKLSFPALPNSRWVGVLSRFVKARPVGKEFQLAIVLSGPEPQRTVFEKKIIHQLTGLNIKSILVRGKLDEGGANNVSENLKVVDGLLASGLQDIIGKSEWVLCRPGYSSVMDMARLNKKVVLVPTPGQTEQEYIGSMLMQKGVALCQRQKDFDLEVALREIKHCTGFVGPFGETNLLAEAIEEALG